ncbi:MAG: hypothetical protein MUO99_02010 [Dehalococcoidales bacterium]|nr:hypothetical protein [Dehalococcoidales bacterium]
MNYAGLVRQRSTDPELRGNPLAVWKPPQMWWVLAALKEDRPYELRDPEGKLISKDEARKLILSKYHVSEDIRRERRRRNSKVSKDRETATYRTNEAAKAPQPVPVQAVSRK